MVPLVGKGGSTIMQKAGMLKHWLEKANDDARLIAINVISWMTIISSVVAIVRLWT